MFHWYRYFSNKTVGGDTPVFEYKNTSLVLTNAFAFSLDLMQFSTLKDKLEGVSWNNITRSNSACDLKPILC